MSRVQLALNVSDLDAAIEFYTHLFQTPPAKIRDGYANFAVVDPPLKLVLFAGVGEPGTLNHIGVEVDSSAEVGAAIRRAEAAGYVQEIQENVTCCHATQDKTWVQGPDNKWEFYTVLDDAPAEESSAIGCCQPAAVDAAADSAEPLTVGARPAACC